MKINNLKINGFGKLKDKEINLENGINVIYGKNEAGKSTLLKYITSIFYGLSKNKNGGTMPENEKYEPWNTEEFSGKISYELDNGNKIEVYRDFKKKNPKIFNENLEDISKEFSIDKTKGNQFFVEQVGLDEEIFTTSIITKQTEVKLNEKEQNTLIQKISNILGTGEDTTSYSTMVNKLKKKLNDEVGTSNTKERPINIVENRIYDLSNQKTELEEYSSYKFEIDERIANISENIEKNKKELDSLRIANTQKEKLKETENRKKINNEMIDSFDKDIQTLKEEHKKIDRNVNEKSTSKIKIIIFIILAIITCLGEIFVPNIIAQIAIAVILIVYLLYFMISYRNKNELKKEVKRKQRQIDEKIKILEQNKEKQQVDLNKLNEEYRKNIEEIKSISNVNDLDNILDKIDIKQRKINEETLKLHTLKIDNDNIIPKLEKLVNIEEELENLKEEKIDLEQKRENIKRTIEYLEIAYNKMKEQITPKFTEELSKVMEKISNGKYKNVRINTNGEIIVEQANGEYVNAENLSIGTIDQLYLSLRIATIKEITQENMPIILDEAFAYYDNERLENILKYLSQEYNNKQVIVFTCTNREIECLEKLNMHYNKIEL